MRGLYWYLGVVLAAALLGYYAARDAAYCVVSGAGDAESNGFFAAASGAFRRRSYEARTVPSLTEIAQTRRQRGPAPALVLTQKGWVLAGSGGEVRYINAPQSMSEFLMHPPSDGWVAVEGAQPAPRTSCVGSLADAENTRPTSNIGVMLNRPVSTLLLLGMSFYAYKLWANRTPVEDVAISYDLVVNQGQLYRIFSASLAHFDLLHLGFNMMSLYNLAPLEELRGSVSFANLSFGLVILTQVLCLLAFHVIVLRTQRPELGQQLAVGYSCVLFAWMVDASVKMNKYCPIPFAEKFCFETFQIPTFGLSETPLPVNLGPFVLLVLIKLFIPRSSFLGHLSGILLGYPLAWNLLDWITPDVLFITCVLAYTHSTGCWVWNLPGYSTAAPLHEFVEQRQLKIQRLLFACFGFYAATSVPYALYFGTIAGLVRVMVAGFVYMCAEAKRCEWLTEDNMVKKDCGRIMTITFVVLLMDGILQTLNLGAIQAASDMINAYVLGLHWPASASTVTIGFAVLLDVCTACVLVLNMVTIPSTVTWLKELGFDPAATAATQQQATTAAFSGRAQTIASASAASSSSSSPSTTRPARSAPSTQHARNARNPSSKTGASAYANDEDIQL